MKLELKHLAPYLPYGIDVCINGVVQKMNSLDAGENSVCYGWGNAGFIGEDEIKPILRPLSDLFKLIDWDNNNDPYMIGYKYGIEKVREDGAEFYANEYPTDYAESPKCYVDITLFDWWLFEYHFDVFGLIEKGLAIDINKLNK